jgi:hypothetical protein
LAYENGIEDWSDLDLDKESGPNFFVGQYSYEALVDSTTVIPAPLVLVIYTGPRRNHQLIQQKNAIFAGAVTVDLEAHLSWPNASPVSSEAWIDVIEAAATYVFNRLGVTWPKEIGYNGDISVEPGPVVSGAQNWRCIVRIGLTFNARHC